MFLAFAPRGSWVGNSKMWYVKNLVDRAQVAFLLWRLRRYRADIATVDVAFIERP
jgi:hypothetical protein